jgi:hypothetical protein
MTRNKGKKRRQKAAIKSKTNNQRQASHDVAENQDNTRNQGQAPHRDTLPGYKFEASHRGGLTNPAADHGTRTFNPSTINAHDQGDQDVTLADVSPAKPVEIYNPLVEGVSRAESRGINIFKLGPVPDRLTSEEAGSSAETQRSLEDMLAENPGSRLSNLDGETLAFAGRAARQVVLEATYDFLQRCIPEPEGKTLWDQICGRNEVKTPARYPVSIPDGTIDLKNGARTEAGLIGNCIDILSQDAPVTDQKTLKLALGRAVTLCDALGDEARRQGLEKAANELIWLIVGLDCKTMELYRVANRQLDKINVSCNVSAEGSREGGVSQCVEQRQEERQILESMQRAHEGFRESFRTRFIETLQILLAL